MWHWLLQLLIFQKLGKSGFCTCHLQESITHWCMTMVMQTWYQLKAEELLLASTYHLGYEYVYFRNSWPLNFDYLFLGTPCISKIKPIMFPNHSEWSSSTIWNFLLKVCFHGNANDEKNGKVQHSYFRLQKFAKHAQGFVNCLWESFLVRQEFLKSFKFLANVCSTPRTIDDASEPPRMFGKHLEPKIRMLDFAIFFDFCILSWIVCVLLWKHYFTLSSSKASSV